MPAKLPAQKIFLIVWTKLSLSSMSLSHDLEIVYATESESDAKAQLASLRKIKQKQRLHIVDTILWRDPKSFSTTELLSMWESCTKFQRDSIQRFAKSPFELNHSTENGLRKRYLLRINRLGFATKNWRANMYALTSVAQRMLKLVRRQKSRKSKSDLTSKGTR